MSPNFLFIRYHATYPKVRNPIYLFNYWHRLAKNNVPNASFTAVATISECGKIRNRYLVLRQVIGDNFIFMTNKLCNSYKDIKTNKKVSLVFCWSYKVDDKKFITRQVRVVGIGREGSRRLARKLYDKEPLSRRVIYYLKFSNKVVSRKDMLIFKIVHFAVRNKIINLNLPPNAVAIEVIPRSIEFFRSDNTKVLPDRVMFCKNKTSGKWSRYQLWA